MSGPSGSQMGPQGWIVPPAPGAATYQGFPVGSLFISIVPTSPATLLGYGSWEELPAGFALVTVDPEDDELDEAENTSGDDEVTPTGTVSQPTFTGSQASLTHAGAAVGNHASHTHDYSQVLNHTHAVNVTDPGHTHTQNSHNHTQNAHDHTLPVGATDDTAAAFDRADAGSNTGGANATANVGSTTAVNQAATATNITNTTGLTATTSNPAAGVATGTTAGPSATLTHSVTQPDAHTHTPQGTVSQPTFAGAAMSVRQKSIAVHAWKRTA